MTTKQITSRYQISDTYGFWAIEEITGNARRPLRQVRTNIAKEERAIEIIRTELDPSAPVDVEPTAPVAANSAPLATEKQVAYAWSLTSRAFRSGVEIDGHEVKSLEQIKSMTRAQVSAYIESMKERY